MPFNVELTEDETRCLQRYFERVDETEDLSFMHPEEYLAFQRIAGQVCRAGQAMPESEREPEPIAEAISQAGIEEVGAASSAGRIRGLRNHSASARPGAFQAGMDDGDVVVAATSKVQALVASCIRAFESGDPLAALSLFADDARVFSPFLGYCPASVFVPKVVGPGGARLTLHDVLTNLEGRPQAVGYFLFERGAADDASKRGRSDVFYYVLNIDASNNVVRSMIVLDSWRD
jgi:hypothetical protein